MGSDRHFAWQQSSGPNVRFGLKADIGARLVDHLIGSHQRCARYRQAECFQGLFINGETEAGWRGVLRRLQNDSQNQTDPPGAQGPAIMPGPERVGLA